MVKTCTISFGNSSKYRIPFEIADDHDIELVKENVKYYLKGRFPQIEDLGFFDRADLECVPKNEAVMYPEFNDTALEEIKNVLAVEVEDEMSLQELNSNAPYDSLNL